MLAHVFLDLLQRFTALLSRLDCEHEGDVARHAIGDRRRLHPAPGEVAGDVERLRGRVREQVVGELENLVLTPAGQQLGHHLWRELRSRRLVCGEFGELGVDDAEVGRRHPHDLRRHRRRQSMPLDGALRRPLAERAALEVLHLFDLAPRGADRLGELVGPADATRDREQKARRGRDLRHGGCQALGPIGRDHAHEHDPIGIQERRLQHRVLQPRGSEPCSFKGVETKVRHQLLAPLLEPGASFLIDEEALVTVQQQRGGAGATGRSRHAGIVLTTAR